MDHCLISGKQRIPLGEFHHRSRQVARGLSEAGISEGDSVALLLRNDVPFLEVTFAAAVLGAYSVPINWHFKQAEIEYILVNCEAKVLVVHADLALKLPASLTTDIQVLVVPTPPEIQAAYTLTSEQCASTVESVGWDTWRNQFTPWDEPPVPARGSMIYTSGTTGSPKGVRRAPASAELQQSIMDQIQLGFALRPSARALMTGPLYHSAPNAYARAVISLGGDLILMPRFDALDFLDSVERHSVTHTHMVPTMFVRLLNLPPAKRLAANLSSLESVVHGAAPCPPDVKRNMINWWGPIVHEYYGSTEAGLITFVTSSEWLKKKGTVGQPLPNSVVRIYGEEGQILNPGEIGDIFVNLAVGAGFTYHNDEKKRAEIERDGLITNGDRGYLDEDNFLFLCDRKADMVISGGVNIYPAEIEAILIGLEGVSDCAVFGIPDTEYGEALGAAIETHPNANLTEQSVQKFLRENMAGYKVPKLVTFHDHLPREDSGKIFKRRLREIYWDDNRALNS